jgi:hypothetical protein
VDRTNSSKKLIAQDRSLGEQEQKVNDFQIHGQTPHVEYFQTDKTILELELGKTVLTPSHTVLGGKKCRIACINEPIEARSHPKCPLPSDRLATARRPPGHEFIARECLVDGFARGLDAGHRQARRIE